MIQYIERSATYSFMYIITEYVQFYIMNNKMIKQQAKGFTEECTYDSQSYGKDAQSHYLPEELYPNYR